MKIVVFHFKFQWNVLPRAQLTIPVCQYWVDNKLGTEPATSHYPNQWWLFTDVRMRRLASVNWWCINLVLVGMYSLWQNVDRNAAIWYTFYYRVMAWRRTGDKPFFLNQWCPCLMKHILGFNILIIHGFGIYKNVVIKVKFDKQDSITAV